MKKITLKRSAREAVKLLELYGYVGSLTGKQHSERELILYEKGSRKELALEILRMENFL